MNWGTTQFEYWFPSSGLGTGSREALLRSETLCVSIEAELRESAFPSRAWERVENPVAQEKTFREPTISEFGRSRSPEPVGCERLRPPLAPLKRLSHMANSDWRYTNYSDVRSGTSWGDALGTPDSAERYHRPVDCKRSLTERLAANRPEWLPAPDGIHPERGASWVTVFQPQQGRIECRLAGSRPTATSDRQWSIASCSR
jgi:hypothetical protein